MMPDLLFRSVVRARSDADGAGEIQRGNRRLATVLLEFGGDWLMHGVRYDRILASTALALILAAPLTGAPSGANAAPPRPQQPVYSPWWGGPVQAPPGRIPQKKATAPKTKPTPAVAAPAAAPADVAPA